MSPPGTISARVVVRIAHFVAVTTPRRCVAPPGSVCRLCAPRTRGCPTASPRPSAGARRRSPATRTSGCTSPRTFATRASTTPGCSCSWRARRYGPASSGPNAVASATGDAYAPRARLDVRRHRGAVRPSRCHRRVPAPRGRMRMAEIAVGARALTAREVTPRAVRFRHAAPADTSEHASLFGCAPEFGAPHTEIQLDDAVLDAPLPHANDEFLSHLPRAGRASALGPAGQERPGGERAFRGAGRPRRGAMQPRANGERARRQRSHDAASAARRGDVATRCAGKWRRSTWTRSSRCRR